MHAWIHTQAHAQAHSGLCVSECLQRSQVCDARALEHTGFLPWNASQLRREEAFRFARRAQYQKLRDRESQAGQRHRASRIGVGRPEAWPWLCLAEGPSRGLAENLLKSSPVPLLSSPEALATAVTRPLSAPSSTKGINSSPFCPSPQARSFPEVGKALCELSGVFSPSGNLPNPRETLSTWASPLRKQAGHSAGYARTLRAHGSCVTSGCDSLMCVCVCARTCVRS